MITTFLSSAGTIINTTCPLALLQKRSLNYHHDAIVMLKRLVIICMQFQRDFLDHLARKNALYPSCFLLDQYIHFVKFSQSEAVSTVLIFRNIKSLISYGISYHGRFQLSEVNHGST